MSDSTECIKGGSSEPGVAAAVLLATLEFHAQARLAAGQVQVATSPADVAVALAAAERCLGTLLRGYVAAGLTLTPGQWLHCAEVANLPPLRLVGVCRAALLSGVASALGTAPGVAGVRLQPSSTGAVGSSALALDGHANVPIAAALLRRLVFLCTTRSEALPLLERTREVVNASLSVLDRTATGTSLRFPVDELDHSITVAWNHGAWFYRIGDLVLAGSFMGWAVSMLSALECLIQRIPLEKGSSPLAATLGCMQYHADMRRQLDHTLALLRKTNRAAQVLVSEQLSTQIRFIAHIAQLRARTASGPEKADIALVSCARRLQDE